MWIRSNILVGMVYRFLIWVYYFENIIYAYQCTLGSGLYAKKFQQHQGIVFALESP